MQSVDRPYYNADHKLLVNRWSVSWSVLFHLYSEMQGKVIFCPWVEVS